MKAFLVTIGTIVSLLPIGCGYQETLRRHCKIGDTQTCDNIFGKNQGEIDDVQSAQLSALSKRVESLSTAVTGLINELKDTEKDLTQTNTLIQMLEQMLIQNQGDMSLIMTTLNDMRLEQESLSERIDYEQARITSMQLDLYNLMSQDGIVEFYDPCGDKSGKYDEILMKTRSGKWIAYFEETGKSERFLTILSPGGSYRTTDNQKCEFSIDSTTNSIVD